MRFRKDRFLKKKSGTQVIGIAGAGRGVGVTHTALMLANYLQSVCGVRTAVLEWNGHGDFSRFAQLCTGQKKDRESCRIQKVDYYPQADAGSLMKCVSAGYERVLIDFGAMEEVPDVEWMRCNAVWVLMSFSEWQMEAFWELAKEKESSMKESWQVFTVFGSEESRIEWNRRRKPEVLRIPLSVDAFTVTREVMEWADRMTGGGSFSGNVSRQNLLKRKRKDPRV